jgi:hypothetical protein
MALTSPFSCLSDDEGRSDGVDGEYCDEEEHVSRQISDAGVNESEQGSLSRSSESPMSTL